MALKLNIVIWCESIELKKAAVQAGLGGRALLSQQRDFRLKATRSTMLFLRSAASDPFDLEWRAGILCYNFTLQIAIRTA
jgi:hypothetical protein